MSWRLALRPSETPPSVPPEPTAETKPSTLPSVSAQISSAVASMWARRLAVLSHWLAQMAPLGSVLASASARRSRIVHVAVGVLVGQRRHLDEVGAEQAQRVLLLLALRLGDDDDGAEAQRVADHGEADAGIAGRAFHHRAAGPQRAALDRVLDDVERGPVLHRLAGVHELGLAEDGAAGLLGGALELDEGRAADRGGHAVGERQGAISLSGVPILGSGDTLKRGWRVASSDGLGASCRRCGSSPRPVRRLCRRCPNRHSP